MKEIIGYYGHKPVYYTKKVIKEKTNRRGAIIMDFSNLKKAAVSLSKYIVIAVIAFLAGMLVNTRQVTSNDVLKEKITLVDVLVTWNPVDEEIVLINKKTSTATVMSKEVTTAVFSLKASAIQQDFTSVTKGGVAPARKVTTSTPQSSTPPK